MDSPVEMPLRPKVSKYMSYLLRHNPEDLVMDSYGFVDLDQLMEKLVERFGISKSVVLKLVETGSGGRFEVVDNRIRALYGHTIPVRLELEEDRTVKTLYHGTTPKAASRILTEGLVPMRRRWVHLSPTPEIAMQVGRRRTNTPTILQIDVESARKSGLKFYRATETVYLCKGVHPLHIQLASNARTT